LGYFPVFIDQKTTMKMECAGEECLASEYDNIFYNAGIMRLTHSGVILIYENFANMKAVRRISDHIPLWAEFIFEIGPEY